MSRIFSFAFAVLAYGLFLAVFLYLVGFLADLPFLPVTVHRGAPSGIAMAVLMDTLLILLFALQHSVMARPAFKRRWTRIVPAHSERSVYVLAASLALAAVLLLWRPIAGTVWQVEGTAALALWALFDLGWAIVLLSTFLLNHFELFGLQQAWRHWRNGRAGENPFRTPFLYRLVRHPLYLGFLIAFWATPVMSYGHLLFSGVFTGWMLLAIRLEERDLIDVFGQTYVEYRQKVGMLLPRLG